jgi:hypothetical protein
MDYAVTEMLEQLHGRLSDSSEFFEAVQADCALHRGDLDGLRSALSGRGFGAAAEMLIEYLDGHGGIELAAKIAEERPDELADVYLRLSEAGPGGEATDSSGTGDPQDVLWAAAVEQFGAAWVSWDGSDSGWVEFRDWFYAAASSQDPEMYAVAYERLDLLNGLGVGERIAHLRELGFDVSGAGEDEAGSDGDPQDVLWAAAVEQFGAAWVSWDGSDSGWVEFRDWFYEATSSQDPEMYALAYERLDRFNDLVREERISGMRELGFDVSGAEVPETPIDPFDEEATAALSQDLEQAMAALNEEELATLEELRPTATQKLIDILGEKLPEELAAQIDVEEYANQVFEDIPGLAVATDEELAEFVTSALADVAQAEAVAVAGAGDGEAV